MERDQAVKFIHELLRAMVAKKASDLFITAGFPPAFKLDGKMTPVSNQSLTPQHTQELARALMKSGVGDRVILHAPGSTEQLQILEVCYRRIPVEPFSEPPGAEATPRARPRTGG